MRSTRSSSRPSTSARSFPIAADSPAIPSSPRYCTAAGTSIVLAMDAAVSDSMLSLVMYCSTNTS